MRLKCSQPWKPDWIATVRQLSPEAGIACVGAELLWKEMSSAELLWREIETSLADATG